MTDESFTETASWIAARVPCDPKLVRNYAAQGLIEFRRLSNGMALFKRSAVAKVRARRTERLARRGRYERARVQEAAP